MTGFPNEREGYTLVPSEDNLNRRDAEAEAWVESYPLDQDAVIAHCREHGYDGATVYTGPHGPYFDGDPAAEGNPVNYCGWIDAREQVIA